MSACRQNGNLQFQQLLWYWYMLYGVGAKQRTLCSLYFGYVYDIFIVFFCQHIFGRKSVFDDFTFKTYCMRTRAIFTNENTESTHYACTSNRVLSDVLQILILYSNWSFVTKIKAEYYYNTSYCYNRIDGKFKINICIRVEYFQDKHTFGV